MPEGSQPSAARRLVEAGLEQLGLAADEAEIAVMEAVDAVYRAPTEALLAAELDGIEPEPGADMSHPPRSVERR